MTTTPTFPQMRARANDGHRVALALLAAGQPVVTRATPIGEAKGLATCMATLRHWGCVKRASGVDSITDLGLELLATLEAKQ